jgi:RimJ/RimL family protein N-acetyltransferase
LNENTPTIYTERLVLRKFTQDDTEALFELLSDEEVNQFLPWFPLKDMGEAEQFLKTNYLRYYELDSAYRYAVCLKEDNQVIGYVCISSTPSFDLGYGLKKAFWHKGIAVEAASAVVKRTRAAGVPYITATHDVHNPWSGKVMKKLGLTYRYSYQEQWMPKDIAVTFRMYQVNFNGNDARVYGKYWDEAEVRFVEENLPNDC